VEDLDGEVLLLLTEHLLLLLLEDLTGAVMGVHDVVAELELDVLDFALLEGLEQLVVDDLVGNDVLLGRGRAVTAARGTTSAGSDPRG
jgi:hypothetical protein